MPAVTKHHKGNAKQGTLPLFILIALICAFLPSLLAAQSKPHQPVKPYEDCLACHGQSGMKADSGKSISIDPAKHAASVHEILSCRDCHSSIKDFPHPAKVAKVQCATCHSDEASHIANS